MSTPKVLLSHTVDATPWADATALRDAIETAIPDVDLRVAHTPSESLELIGDATVLVTAFLPSDHVDAAENLEWVQALSAGVDFFDRAALAERDIALTSAAGVHAEPVAEQVVGYLLTFERGLHTAARQQRRGVWERFGGGEVRGKTLGIVGLGAIGGRVAEYGQAFGMTVLGTKRNPASAPDAVDEVFGTDGLETVLRRADYLVLACPLTEETRGLIGSKELGVLGEDAVLVNVARGEVVDEGALTYQLQQGGIGGAALDVFETEPLPADSPLWDLSNVVVTPHMAGATPRKAERLADVFARNYEAYVDAGVTGLENRVV